MILWGKRHLGEPEQSDKDTFLEELMLDLNSVRWQECKVQVRGSVLAPVKEKAPAKVCMQERPRTSWRE